MPSGSVPPRPPITILSPLAHTKCGAMGCKHPAGFRLAFLEGSGFDAEFHRVDPSVSASLFCRHHAVEEAAVRLGVIAGRVEAPIPTLGFLLLPLDTEPKLASELQAEIAPEG